MIKTFNHITSNCILFSSATGKDSICLLDSIKKQNINVIPVFMFIVPDLESDYMYINWAQKKYNVEFISLPHFALAAYFKYGTFGCEKKKISLTSLADIDNHVRKKTGIEWSVYGFKKTDSMNRRLMLNTYEESFINRKTQKIYPLSDCNNNYVLSYIKFNNLIQPRRLDNLQSQGGSIIDSNYLEFLKNNYLNDLLKIKKIFPAVELYEKT